MRSSRLRRRVSTGVFAGAVILPLFASIYVTAPAVALSSSFARPLPLSSRSTHELTIGWVGDMVPADIDFNAEVFSNVSTELTLPDLMIGNLEGTFAHEDRLDKCRYILSMCHAFRGDPNFADELQNAGFDFVNLVNNHAYDYGDEGLTDTEAELDRVGIPYISPTKPSTSITIKNTHIGILGLSSTEPAQTITDYDFITEQIQKLKETNDIVVVIFHGGAEGSTRTAVTGETEYMGTENRGNVQLVAHAAIDAGADLVLGSGPHVLRKIEQYKGKTIAYSLGNFIGGNNSLNTTGILGVSGIFSAQFENNIETAHDFLSVQLSSSGVPSVDEMDKGKDLIEELSR